MPSSEVRYQRGDHYRPYEDDILRARRSSSSGTSSVLSGGGGAKRRKPHPVQAKHFGSATSAENAAIRQKVNLLPAVQKGGEEYLTKKKVEVKTTKNTEKRVQRCIVLEDGRIIEHDDPHIIVDTIEDTQTHEFDHLEDRALAKELQASIERSYQRAGIPQEAAAASKKQRRKSLAYDNMISRDEEALRVSRIPDHSRKSAEQVSTTEAGSIVNDTYKRIVNTHDVKENIVRTHAAKDLGMISQKGLRKVLKKQGKVSDFIKYDDSDERGSASRSRRSKKQKAEIVRHQHESENHRRIVDTEDIHEISRRMKDGQIRSETIRTEKHEIFDNKAVPDDKVAASGSSETEQERDEQQFCMTKTHDFTDYYDGRGNHLMKGPNLTSQDMKISRPKGTNLVTDHRWAEVTDDRIRQTRHSVKKRLRPDEDAERKDALTQKPLDLGREEKTRKKETNKWLERHFGSDWSLAGIGGLSSNCIKYLKGDDAAAGNGVRRTMSFSSIPIHYTNPGEKVSRVIKQTTTTIRPGFDKHVVSSITKSMEPKRNKSLEAGSRPYHSTLTLATDGQRLRPLDPHSKKHFHASATSLHPESSQLTGFRKVPIEQQQPRTRVQRLIDHERSSNASFGQRSHRSKEVNRRSYYYGEESRVQSEPPRKSRSSPMQQQQQPQQVERQQRWNEVASHKRTPAPPLYRTELLKTSNKMYNEDNGETESVINRRNWRHELSQSYHDISWNNQTNLKNKDMTQSYNELPSSVKPSQLFGWCDEFQLHNYNHERGRDRGDGHGCSQHVQRSKSFAIGSNSDQHSSSNESSFLHYKQHHKKSYKDTKVSKTVEQDYHHGETGKLFFPQPPKEFAGLATDIQQKYNEAKHGLHSKKKTKKAAADAVYEFERKIPMQSSILEAQKFKTVIFVSGN